MSGAVLFLFLGCGPQSTDNFGVAKSIDDQAEFFAPNTFYQFQIHGWDSSLMANDALEQEVCRSEDETHPALAYATLTISAGDPSSDDACPAVEASTVVYETDEFCLRTSGNLTNGTPKSSYKISLEDDRFAGMNKLNLKSMWNDVSQMRESLVWTMMDQAGLPAERHTYARLCMNPRGDEPNTYRGLYSVIEQVDKRFLRDRFGNDNDEGNLYKAQWADLGPATLAYRGDDGADYYTSSDIDERTYELKTNDDDDDPPEFQTYDDLAKLIAVVDGRGIPEGYNSDAYRHAVEEIFDARGFLRWAGVNMLVGAWDNYWRTPANYHLYNAGYRDVHDGFMDAPYFYWVPHDYDNTLGIDYFRASWHEADLLDWEGATAYTVEQGSSEKSDLPFVTNLLKNDWFRAYYLEHIKYLLQTTFTEDWFSQNIGGVGSGGDWDRVRHAAMAEGWMDQAPATGRQFTNDEVYYNGFLHRALHRRPLQELEYGDAYIMGILKSDEGAEGWVRLRRASAWEQLNGLDWLDLGIDFANEGLTQPPVP